MNLAGEAGIRKDARHSYIGFPAGREIKDSLMMQKRWQATRIYVIIINMIL